MPKLTSAPKIARYIYSWHYLSHALLLALSILVSTQKNLQRRGTLLPQVIDLFCTTKCTNPPNHLWTTDVLWTDKSESLLF
ncbi:hypothetical protein J6590_067556 [Homalodisca vitripennis]|nr:hypothetical protein J6590_067556 [Homalodisca vitripennis]